MNKLELSLDKIEKKGFDHYMLKEIYEQPKAIEDTLRGRLNISKGLIKFRRNTLINILEQYRIKND